MCTRISSLLVYGREYVTVVASLISLAAQDEDEVGLHHTQHSLEERQAPPPAVRL
jgi:hypothetical protein